VVGLCMLLYSCFIKFPVASPAPGYPKGHLSLNIAISAADQP
jgi:hypothetical protein